MSTASQSEYTSPFRTFGTHNMLDGATRAIGFADVVLLTECPKKRIRDWLIPGTKRRVSVKPLKEHPIARTHTIYVCRWQRDLAIAVVKNVRQEKVKRRYRPVHGGVPGVTPHRGTFWLNGLWDGTPGSLFDEHRINAWYRPWKRGERWLRERWHNKHHRITNRIIERRKRKGFVAAGGDPNAPHRFRSYPGLHEFGTHLDRVATSEPIDRTAVLSKGGSDHHRIKVWVKKVVRGRG